MPQAVRSVESGGLWLGTGLQHPYCDLPVVGFRFAGAGLAAGLG